MLSFTPVQQGEIRRFADTLGVDAIAAADGSFNFEFERLGRLTLQPGAGDRLMASLSRKISFASSATMIDWLSAARIDPMDGSMIHAGLSGEDDFVLVLDLPASGVSAADLDVALTRLAQAIKEIE